MWRNGELAAVIGWDRFKVRPFGEEVVRSATLLFGHDDSWLDLGRVSVFVEGYLQSVTITDDNLLDVVDRLWWKRMCDYWHLESTTIAVIISAITVPVGVAVPHLVDRATR